MESFLLSFQYVISTKIGNSLILILKRKLHNHMKRKSRFIAGLLAAVATFATLNFTLGPKYHGHWRSHHGCYHECQAHEQHPPEATK